MLKRNPTTPKPSKGLLRSFFIGFLTLSSAFAVSSAALFSSRAAIDARAEEASFTPGEETEVEQGELNSIITSAALTDSSESINARFTSKRTTTYPNGAQRKNVYVTAVDPSFDPVQVQRECEAAQQEAAQKGEEYVPLEIEARVHCIRPVNSNPVRIIIPSTVTYAGLFVMKVTTISAEVCFNDKGAIDYSAITDIVIPSTITNIEEDAFPDTPEDFKIYCQSPEFAMVDEVETPTYEDGWTDAEIVYDYELSASDSRALNVNSSNARDFGTGSPFFIGINSEKYHLPAYMEYQLVNDANGESDGVSHFMELPIVSSNNPYNGVGSLLGLYDLSMDLVVDIPEGSRVDLHSIRFHNIYRVLSQGSERIPDETTGPLLSKPVVNVSYDPAFHEFLGMKPRNFTTLGKYFQVEIDFSKVLEPTGYGIYPVLAPSAFDSQKAALEQGVSYIRYRLTNLSKASYRFTANIGGTEKTMEKTISTPRLYQSVLIEGDVFTAGFLVDISDIPDFDAHAITKVELCGFTLELDIYSTKSKSIVNHSAVNYRFGRLTIVSPQQSVSRIDVPTILVWTYIIYVAAFTLLAILYYFYAKRRFRNDEFRRMNTKRYVIAALKNFVGYALVLSSLLFIICRWALLRTTVVTTNPLDIFVILFTIAAVIFLGFTIKNLVVSIKDARKRAEAARLGLDQDEADDGTH